MLSKGLDKTLRAGGSLAGLVAAGPLPASAASASATAGSSFAVAAASTTASSTSAFASAAFASVTSAPARGITTGNAAFMLLNKKVQSMQAASAKSAERRTRKVAANAAAAAIAEAKKQRLEAKLALTAGTGADTDVSAAAAESLRPRMTPNPYAHVSSPGAGAANRASSSSSLVPSGLRTPQPRSTAPLSPTSPAVVTNPSLRNTQYNSNPDAAAAAASAQAYWGPWLARIEELILQRNDLYGAWEAVLHKVHDPSARPLTSHPWRRIVTAFTTALRDLGGPAAGRFVELSLRHSLRSGGGGSAVASLPFSTWRGAFFAVARTGDEPLFQRVVALYYEAAARSLVFVPLDRHPDDVPSVDLVVAAARAVLYSVCGDLARAEEEILLLRDAAVLRFADSEPARTVRRQLFGFENARSPRQVLAQFANCTHPGLYYLDPIVMHASEAFTTAPTVVRFQPFLFQPATAFGEGGASKFLPRLAPSLYRRPDQVRKNATTHISRYNSGQLYHKFT